VPNSAWAGSLAGQTIPAGDPRNPLRVVFMSLGGAIGIHGTSEPWSIGSRASHGCIRMRAGDVRNLANRTPVGTPVLIR
jgi:lipoprotein-anchoring transpeptidase ErfK/SrfK